MMRVVLPLIVVAVAVAAVPARAQGFKWWLSPSIQAELHLTDEQARTIDTIFETDLPERRHLREQLDQLDGEVSALLADPTTDDDSAAALIARVEAMRARRNVARTMMLFRIRRVLTPDQRTWFDRRVSANASAAANAKSASTAANAHH